MPGPNHPLNNGINHNLNLTQQSSRRDRLSANISSITHQNNHEMAPINSTIDSFIDRTNIIQVSHSFIHFLTL